MTTDEPRESRGFVLVGVIMFVLALTILGMSLFAVSGYEASFLGQSRDENTALYAAQGGIDMVVQLLAVSPPLLQNAQLAQGHDGIVSAVATQKLSNGSITATGPVSPDTVTITVVASAFGVERKLVAKFRPENHESYYKRMLTIAGQIDVLTHELPDPVGSNLRDQTYVVASPDSGAWVNDPDPTCINPLSWAGHPLRQGGVPQPEVPAFIAAHPLSSCLTPPDAGPTVTLHQHSGGPVDYYRYPPSSGEYTIYEPSDLTIDVTGTAVLILPEGLRVDNALRVHASSPATLVLIGSPHSPRVGGAGEEGLGLRFTGGVNADPNVKLILVSDGGILFQQSNNFPTSYRTDHLSIYCGALQMIGPQSPQHSYLGYDTATMNPVIDALEAASALPGAHGATNSALSFLKGSWRDLTP